MPVTNSKLPITDEMLNKLSASDRIIVDKLIKKMDDDGSFVNRACFYLIGQAKQKQAEHLVELSPELQMQACIEYLIIALISGELKKKDLEKILQLK